MIDPSMQNLETQLYIAGREFPYPPTPDIALAVSKRLKAETTPRTRPTRRRVLALATLLFLVVLLSSLVIPPVRAQILEFLQIGIIRILLVEPTPTPSPLPPTPGLPAVLPVPSITFSPAPSPRPSPTPLSSLLDLQGETSLEQAQSQLEHPIQLPGYPADLGLPDRVYLQNLNGQILVLVWLDPQQPDRVRLSLHAYTGKDNLSGTKTQPVEIETTSVNGQPAVWATGPYLIKLSDGNYDLVRLIEGHVLIWQEGEVTHRLETEETMEEAVRIAESLRPLDESIPH